MARVLPEPADAITEKFRSSSRVNRSRDGWSIVSISVLARKSRVRQLPFLAEEIEIDRQRGQRISARDSIFGENSAKHSEHARILHAMQLTPEIFLGEYMLEKKLRFEIAIRRKQRHLHTRRTERVYRQRIQGELHAATFHELFPQLFLRRLISP